MKFWKIILTSQIVKYIPLNNESCLARPKNVNLNPDGLHYHPFIVNLDQCGGDCNILHDPSAMIFDLFQRL